MDSKFIEDNINYHIMGIPKYLKPVLVGRVKEGLRTIIEGQCYDMQIQKLALEIMPDHLHLFVGAKQISIPFKIINQLKGNTSIQLRRFFPHLHYLGYKYHAKKFSSLLADGYYCGSAGHFSQEQVKKYILEQEGKPIFEYDIYGCPQHLKGQLKIGDFTN